MQCKGRLEVGVQGLGPILCEVMGHREESPDWTQPEGGTLLCQLLPNLIRRFYLPLAQEDSSRACKFPAYETSRSQTSKKLRLCLPQTPKNKEIILGATLSRNCWLTAAWVK